MRRARVIFRPEGIHEPSLEDLRSIMFFIGYDDRPTTAAECQQYEQAIRIWVERTHRDDGVAEIWFSRPEVLTWKPWPEPRCGQDIVVEGGATLRSGHAYRLLLELHAQFCNCAYCGDEDYVTDEWEWVHVPDASTERS